MYMVKEAINEAVHGTFVKYIGNGSVKPFEFLDGPAAYWAEFLAFSQHVQYLKTKGLAFIGDFQSMSNMRNYPYVQLVLTFSISGGTCLLTDPQIITASYVSLQYSNLDSNPICYRDTALIFSDGNLCQPMPLFLLNAFAKCSAISSNSQIVQHALLRDHCSPISIQIQPGRRGKYLKYLIKCSVVFLSHVPFILHLQS